MSFAPYSQQNPPLPPHPFPFKSLSGPPQLKPPPPPGTSPGLLPLDLRVNPTLNQGPHGSAICLPSAPTLAFSHPSPTSLIQSSVFLAAQLFVTTGPLHVFVPLPGSLCPTLSSGQLLLLCEAFVEMSLLQTCPRPHPGTPTVSWPTDATCHLPYILQ